MMNLLDTITQLSREFGSGEYVKAGGGNTSCKTGDTLWVKPYAFQEDWELITEQVVEKEYELEDGSGFVDEKGRSVPQTAYYLRRLADGDLIEVKGK